MTHHGTWDVVVVAAPKVCTLSTGALVLAHSEWVRLFLGRSVAQARVIEGDGIGSSVEYLVSGRAPEGDSRPGAADALAETVWGAFEELAAALSAHRELVAGAAERGLSFHPEIFTRMYGVLRHVTVSSEVDDWRVTDEGISIVRWGLQGDGRVPLLCWSDAELRAMRDRVLTAYGLPLTQPHGSGGASSRAAATIADTVRALGERPAPREQSPSARSAASRGSGEAPPRSAPAPSPAPALAPAPREGPVRPRASVPAPARSASTSSRPAASGNAPASSGSPAVAAGVPSAPQPSRRWPEWLPWSVAALSAVAAVTFLLLAASARSRATRAEDRAQRSESELEAVRQERRGARP
jgi:hypothetical protein